MPAYHRANLPDFAQLYGHNGDVDFRSVLAIADVPSDEALAEVVEADGRWRLARRLPVPLSRYLGAVPTLLQQPDSLDAAIDVALRSMAGGSRITPAAVRSLSDQHPQLAGLIEEAAALNAAIWSTTGLRERVALPPSKQLPCEFGPLLPSGEHRYLLNDLLGQGAFGQVYLARDRQLSEANHSALVAIKLLPGSSQGSEARQRIIDEAVKVRRINHPNVVQVLDRGSTDLDEDFIVYEYVDGGDLGQSLPSMAGSSIADAATMIAKIARGVHAAHSAGVIHCDLKPGNIMLTAAGEPKVADFGIAVRMGNQAIGAPTNLDEGIARGLGPVGNIAFISPEQYRGGDQAFSIPSDIYALGGMLFLLLTGQLPNGDTYDAIERNHDLVNGRQSAPSPAALRPEIDEDLDAICRRAMALRPDDRPPSAAALAEDLEHWLAHEPIRWMRPGLARTTRLWMRRKPGLAVAFALIGLLVISGTGIALYLGSLANQRALDVALTQLKLDEKTRRDLATVAALQKVAAALKAQASDYRLNTEVLVQIWALEYAFGPAVLDKPDAQSELWKGRIANIRKLVLQARASGRGDDVETLMWESALAFWLACDHEFIEAEDLLAGNRQRWAQRLAPQDDWLSTLDAIADCAAANRLLAAAAASPLAEADASEVARRAARLEQASDRMRPDHRGTPVHRLILTRLMELQGPGLLNRPEAAQHLETQLQKLANSKPGKAASTEPAATAPQK